MRDNAGPFLEDGETIQAVFGAQTKSQYWLIISLWIIIWSKGYRVVVVTDRRILVCQSGRLRVTPVEGIIHELPRSTRIGPTKGVWYRCEQLGDKLYIHRRFHKDVATADSLIDG